MRNILIPAFEIVGTNSYPDSIDYFKNISEITLGGLKYYLCEYTGSKSLETGPHTYADYLAQQQQNDLLPFSLNLVSVERQAAGAERLPVQIEQPNNIVPLNEGDTSYFRIELKDRFGKHLAYNGSFDLPIAGELGSRPLVIQVHFINGFADIVVSNWEQGRWRVTENEINIDLGENEPRFTFSGLIIKVRQS